MGSGVLVFVGGGVTLGTNVLVLVGTGTVLVGSAVADGTRVFVAVGVLVGVLVMLGVALGGGVSEGVNDAVGSGVAVGGGGGVGVPVTVGVEEGVQEMIGRGTGLRTNWQPLAKSMVTPKSLLTTSGRAPPPAQSLSKSICQVFEVPASNGSDPDQIVGEELSKMKSPFPPRWI